MDQVVIRRATTNDIDQVLDLSQEGFDYDAKFDGTLKMSWSQSAEGRAYFVEKATEEQSLLLLAAVESDVVGFLSAAIKSTDSYRIPLRTGELEVMLVSELFRGKNIGSRLVQSFFDWCRNNNCSRSKVVASAGNTRALDFYREMGFSDYTVTLEKEM